MTHRLDRLELEIHVAEEGLARPLQDRLSRLHQQALADLLGRVLDELSPPGTLHRLESLELDLGEIPEEQLERLLPERLEQVLRELLSAKLPNILDSDAIENGGAMSASRALELLAAHATTGQLPWWATRQNARLIPEALQTALALPPQDLAAWWRQEVPQASARQRLLTAAEPDQAARLQKLLREGSKDEGDASVGGIPEDQETALVLLSPLQATRWRLELPQAGTQQRLLAEEEPEPVARQRAVLGEAPGEEPAVVESDAPVATEGHEKLANTTPAAQTTSSAACRPSSALKRLAAYANTGRLPEGNPSQQDEPLTLDGAGLVMLNPFLETFFNRLNWLTPERRFLGPAEQRRAVALLSFLVSGEANPPEWRLTLAKLLCGLELESLCSLEAPLSEREQAEGEGLLLAALNHGQGLLGDAISPLRKRMLERPALLSWRPGAWLLVVERREGDEVLEELPWSWGWIRLPWMEELLQVVW